MMHLEKSCKQNIILRFHNFFLYYTTWTCLQYQNVNKIRISTYFIYVELKLNATSDEIKI